VGPYALLPWGKKRTIRRPVAHDAVFPSLWLMLEEILSSEADSLDSIF
jgi:hypothetical protein